MGAAEVIAFEEVRARNQWDALRGPLQTRFDPWLDGLEAPLPEPAPPLAQVTETVWHLRQELTGGVTETIVAPAQRGESTRQQTRWPQGDRVWKARASVSRTVETRVGTVPIERPYFSCRPCPCGVSPLEAAWGWAPGRTPRDGPKAAVTLVTAVPYDEAQTLCGALPGVGLGRERMHTVTTHIAAGLTVVDVLPPRNESEQRIAAVSAGRYRRPVVVRGIAGAYGPTRPARARKPCAGYGRPSAKRARGRGQWRDAKGCRVSLLDGERLVHGRSGPQGQHEEQRGEALTQVKEAGVRPAEQGRLCGVCDGAEWLGKQVQALFPHARQVLEYSHGAQSRQRVAKAHEGASVQAVAWVEATMTRLSLGQVGLVLGGLPRLQAQSQEAAKALAHCGDDRHEPRGRTTSRQLRRGG
jgi:hypothetical protein